jgi:hypothetical protein
MISRREVVTAGVLGTLATTGTANAAEVQQDVQTLKEGFKALEDEIKALRSAIAEGFHGSSMSYGNVGAVKDKIERYAKTSGKFPDYCEVGLSVYHDIYDWHVRNQQQIQIVRISEQRLAIQFMFTQLILRWENDNNFVGTPYDR